MLLNHPHPYPDEAFTSWLWRLAHRNYIASPKGLLPSFLSLGHTRTWKTHEPREPAMFRALAALTNTSVETIHAHTLHRFAHLLTAPEEQAPVLDYQTDPPLTLAPVRPNRDFFRLGFAWCPACLGEARYVRLHWHVPLVVGCVRHSCWLLEACPTCNAPIGETEMLRGRCTGCRFVLEQAPLVSIPADDLLLRLQREILCWLYQPERSQFALANRPVGVLLRVLYGLRFSTQRAGSDWDFQYVPVGVPAPQLDILKQRSLTVFERGCLYATAFRGLLDWPHGFYTFLEAYRTRPAAREKTGLRSEFGTLYISWLQHLWKHPAFDFIQQAFNAYLLKHIPVHQIVKSLRIRDYPELLEQVDYLDLKGAVKYLGSSNFSVYRLVEEGHLTVTRFPADPAGIWFDRHELGILKTDWQQHIPFPTVARQLGVSKRLAGELLNARMLQRVSLQYGLKQQGIFVHQDSLDGLLRGLRTFTTIRSSPENAVPLLTVCIRNGIWGVDLPYILNRILVGKFPAYHPDDSLLPLTALWFMPHEVAALAQTVRADSEMH